MKPPTSGAEIFGQGYGEENDFCLRALYKGYESLLAADVFVYHASEVSFGPEAKVRRRLTAEILQKLYPEYGRMVASHLRNGPAKPSRIVVSPLDFGRLRACLQLPDPLVIAMLGVMNLHKGYPYN